MNLWTKQRLNLTRAFALFALVAFSACDGEPGDEASTPDSNIVIGDAGTDADIGTMADADVIEDGGSDAELDAIVDAGEPLAPLSINSLVPNRGPELGGTSIRVIGSGFVEGMQVIIGGLLCVNLEVESSNHLRCETPIHGAGSYPVSVVRVTAITGGNPDDEDSPAEMREQADLPAAFTYFAEVTIEQVSPERIPVRGGAEVTVRGTGLIEGTQLTIGGERANNVEVSDDGTVLQALAPPGPPGPAHVSVSNFNGSVSIRGGMYYFEEIAVDRLSPPVGPLGGGTPVTIHGVGLTDESRVTFVPNDAEIQMGSEDRLSLEVNAPGGLFPGHVNVNVENENGTATITNGYLYYDDTAEGFSVAGVSPTSGPVAGGTTLFVVGSGFTVNSAATIDGRGMDCNFVDAHRLECTTPPSIEGAVDVAVEEGGSAATLEDAYTYFQDMELIAITPDRGSIGGGTLVTISGTGFTPDMVINLGEVELAEAQFIDDTTIVGTTPPNSAGPVDVRVSTEFARSTLGAGFTYYDPIADFGGAWGEEIEGNVNVTVINGGNGERLEEVALLLINDDETLTLEALTDVNGQATIAHPDLDPTVNITAAKEGFEVTTIENVAVENVTIFLIPNDGEGEPPPPVPGVMFSGVVTGLDVLPKPSNETFVNIIVVETSHSQPRNRGRLPPPGPNALLFEDGPFEAFGRPGEVALVATAGEIDRAVLDAYEAGGMDYWSMRSNLVPLRMGLRRFISASPGDEIGNLDIELNAPLDLIVPVDLDNPPQAPDPGPRAYAALPSLSFGPEGYFMLDTAVFALDPFLELRRMPRMEAWDADITVFMMGVAYSLSQDNLPMAICVDDVRDLEAGLLMGPFPGTAFILNPQAGGQLGADRIINWGVHDGFEGPIHPPSANLILVSEPALGPPKPLWRYVTPPLVTEVEVPELPEAAGAAGLGGGMMFLTVNPFILRNGELDFDDFTYDDLAQYTWRSWGITTITFTQ